VLARSILGRRGRPSGSTSPPASDRLQHRQVAIDAASDEPPHHRLRRATPGSPAAVGAQTAGIGGQVFGTDPEACLRGAGARGTAASSAGLSVEVLQELVCCELDLLVPPLRGTVVAGDQPHPVQTAEVAVDERVVRLRLLGRALGEAEMPGGVFLPGVRLQERVLLPCAAARPASASGARTGVRRSAASRA
jgi:hypothetical protein